MSMAAALCEPSLSGRLRSIKHVMLDMDGTIYCGGRLFETTKPFLEVLSSLGIGFSFLTNNSSMGVDDYLEKLSRMGLPADERSLYTSTLFAADYIKERLPAVRRVHALGTESMKLELQRCGFEIVSRRPDAVVVGYDVELSYRKLGHAAYWLREGAAFIATHPDRFCPTEQPDFLAIDCGWLTDFLMRVTGREPLVLGKPSPEMIRFALRRHPGIEVEEVAMCGDRHNTDMKMALDSGAFSVHISQGPSGEAPEPDLSVRDLMGFGRALLDARRS